MRLSLPLVLLVAVFLVGCGQINGLARDDFTTQVEETLGDPIIFPYVGIDVGEIAPDFTVTTTEGEEVRIQSFPENNKPVLVYFMATWCPYCARDYAALSEIFSEYEDDVPILSISLDLKEDAPFLAEYKKKYPALEKMFLATGTIDVLQGYQVRSTTTKYAIGRNGTILYTGSGAIDAEQWRTLLEALKAS